MRQVVARRAGGPEVLETVDCPSPLRAPARSSSAPRRSESTSRTCAWLERDEIAPRIDRVLPLERAAEAHARLHARENVGKIVLVP